MWNDLASAKWSNCRERILDRGHDMEYRYTTATLASLLNMVQEGPTELRYLSGPSLLLAFRKRLVKVSCIQRSNWRRVLSLRKISRYKGFLDAPRASQNVKFYRSLVVKY